MTLINDTQRPKTIVAADHASDVEVSTVIDCQVRRCLANCSYEFFLNQVTWHFDEGCLTLSGQVQTEHLRHALESLLSSVEHVEHIVNCIDVVSSTGVSNIRPR
jgi:hypothetical protein